MSAVQGGTLRLPRGSRLEAVYAALSPEERVALTEHLLGGTSSKWIAETLTECGHQIGASSVKRTRKSLKGGVQL